MFIEWIECCFQCSNLKAYKRINDKFDIHCRMFEFSCRQRERTQYVWCARYLHNNIIRCTPEYTLHRRERERKSRKLICSFICSVLVNECVCVLFFSFFKHPVHKCKFDNQVYKSPHSIVINCIHSNSGQVKGCRSITTVHAQVAIIQNTVNCNHMRFLREKNYSTWWIHGCDA